ncbi:MAG: UDP-N-acetylglucosamine 2-epimerase (non-hydrolyzing) [Deltaproteobacteria bacterium]|nr:UDP-N-acetylglucosamine 2-epimerase (non-hydrolyzing) [Deltaproteobacteria bacterium]
MKLVTVVGARPQFIKAAAVSRAIAAHNASSGGPNIHEVIVHTGQHYDTNMSAVFFTEMEIPRPDHSLGVREASHGAMTARMLEGVERVLLAEKPDCVLVYGDTNSTLAGALAGAKIGIPVAHVEAGLRSYNRRMPEEINRVVTDHVSTLLFCPTQGAVDNLASEGICHGERAGVHLVGDVMLDAALFYARLSGDKSRVLAPGTELGALVEGGNRDFALCTVHRAENTDDPARLEALFRAVGQVAETMPVVLPLHPRTRKKLAECDMGGLCSQPGLHVTEPLGYFDMLELLKACRLVITDSGGLQKEAFFFDKPCVTLRAETEWVELLEHGVNMLAGEPVSRLPEVCGELLSRASDFTVDLYGTGVAGKRIVGILVDAFPSEK